MHPVDAGLGCSQECEDPHSRPIHELERTVLKLLAKRVEGFVTDAQKQVCRAILGTPRATWMRGNLRAANWPEFDGVRPSIAAPRLLHYNSNGCYH